MRWSFPFSRSLHLFKTFELQKRDMSWIVLYIAGNPKFPCIHYNNWYTLYNQILLSYHCHRESLVIKLKRYLFPFPPPRHLWPYRSKTSTPSHCCARIGLSSNVLGIPISHIFTITVCPRGYLGVHRHPVSPHIMCIRHLCGRPVHSVWGKHSSLYLPSILVRFLRPSWTQEEREGEGGGERILA